MGAYKIDNKHIGLNLYTALTEDGIDEKTKAKIISETIENLAERFPRLENVATTRELSETELRLTKEIREIDARLSKDIEGVKLEIEIVKGEIKETELKLSKEIDGVRLEIKEVDAKLTKEIRELDLKLTKEIEGVKLEVANVRSEIKESSNTTLKWIISMMFVQVLAVGGMIFTLAKFLQH